MAIKELKVDLTPKKKKTEVYARRSMLSKTISGSWSTSFKGRGIEFAGYRSYQYGDDASMIDWRASLRSKSTLVREFDEYRSFSVFILVDVSNSMLFSSTDKLKAEYAAEIAHALADGILKGGDAVGLGMFTDHLLNPLFPDIGSGMLDKIRKELSNNENYGGAFNLKKVIKETTGYLNGNAVLILISDFLGMEKGWERYINMLAQHFELIGIMVKDPRDRTLPKGTGQYSLEDPYTGEFLYVDPTQYVKEYHKMVEKEEKYIKNIFEKVRGGFTMVTTDKDFSDAIALLFRKRQFVIATM